MLTKTSALLNAAVLALGLAGSATSATAATVSATSLLPSFSNFTIDFNDSNGNRLLDIGEVTSFSGLFVTDAVFGVFNWDSLMAIADIPGISVAGAQPGFVPQLPGNYVFRISSIPRSELSVSPSRYQFSVSGLPAPVPLPASLPLLALGLGAVAVARRRA